MAAEIRLEFVQNSSPRVWVDGNAANMQGLGRAIAFLVLLRGKKVDRSLMARTLWPQEDDEVAANRLRVTLTRLRALLGASVEIDRGGVRLRNATIQCDLWDESNAIRDALDEIDPREQVVKLTSHSGSIRSQSWRTIEDIGLDSEFAEWNKLCQTALERTAELANREGHWELVDLVFKWMRDRGDLLKSVCERYLDAHSARNTVEEGLRIVARSTRETQQDSDTKLLQSLRLYGQQLQVWDHKEQQFDTSHYQALGSALLGNIERHAPGLGALLISPEVQLSLQSVPDIYLAILDSVSANLEPGEEAWVGVQSAKIAAYASLYDYDHVISTCESVFPFEMSPTQRTSAWMHYSFSFFQLRRWDEAFSTIQKAQELALGADLTRHHDTCRITEGAYLWHMGRADEAREIYDTYLAKYADSDDFSVGVNRATCLANYAIIELVFGDLQRAKDHAELAYGERTKFNLTRHMPSLLALLSVIYARTGDLARAVESAIESLKLTYPRGSSREGQINMEWICGVLVAAGLREEASQIMRWVNNWRKQTRHERSVCENQFAASLQLQDMEGSSPTFSDSHDLRDVMRFQIKCLRMASQGKAD